MTYTLVWAGGSGSFELWRPTGVLLEDNATVNTADLRIATVGVYENGLDVVQPQRNPDPDANVERVLEMRYLCEVTVTAGPAPCVFRGTGWPAAGSPAWAELRGDGALIAYVYPAPEGLRVSYVVPDPAGMGVTFRLRSAAS